MAGNDPISTALLAYGMSGEVFHAPLIKAHEGFKLSKILERQSNRSRQRYPDVEIVRSINDILNDKSIELVVVNTPHETHFALASLVLDAGKHAIVEKPFTTTVSEAMRLQEMARQNGVTVSVFHNRRWDGDFLTVQKIVQAGLLGQLVEFEAHYDRYRPSVDSSTWKELPGPGSGILYNLGAHLIDQALVLFGTPREVNAKLNIQRPGGKADDFYDIRMMYDGLHVILKSSYLVREPGPRYTLHGVNGSFVKYGIDPQEEALKNGAVPTGAAWGREPEAAWGLLNTQVSGLHLTGRIETETGNYLQFYQNMFEAIRQQKPLAVTATQAMETIRIIEACIESNASRATVVL